jgi:hypothetical protein
MTRRSPLIFAVLTIAFTLASLAFAAWGTLCKLSINDAEWTNIRRTGLPSSPEKLRWTPWQTNDGAFIPFTAFQPENQPAELPEYRIGTLRALFLHFQFYQGRFMEKGAWREFPAFGPGWGTYFHWHWIWIPTAPTIASFTALVWAVRRD